MKKLFVYLIFFICTSSFGQSIFDNYVYQSWNSFDGLNGTTATDIFQTKDGFINIGTYEGLVRFDGISFNVVKRSKDNDFRFVSVRAILEDSSGNLWLGSNDEGVQKISKDGDKLYTIQNGLPNNSIRALCEDKKKNIWVGTASGVAYITPEGRIITPQFQAGTIGKGVIATHLFCDSAGRIWLLTSNERGLYIYTDGLFHTLKELDSYGSYFATSIAQDYNGDFWIGLGVLGIFHMNGGKIVRHSTNTFLDRIPTTAIFPARNGIVWFGTEKGLAIFDKGYFYEYKGKKSLENATINKIVCDRENNIWIATDKSGFGKLTRGKFRMIHSDSAINSLTEDKTGLIWAATDKGVRCYQNETEVSNELTTFTRDIRIRDVQATKNGDILVSCYKKPGFIRYGKNGIKTWSKDSGLAGDKVRVAIEAKTGEVYVGTTTGLSIIRKDGSIKNFKQIDGLENEYVMALYQDTNDVIWVGTDGGGIYLIRDEKLYSYFSSEDGLVGNVIFKIAQGIDGAFIICTGSGISCCPGFDSLSKVPTVFKNVNAESGLESDSIFQLIDDRRNDVWMISNHGISSVPFSDFLSVTTGYKENMKVKFYSRNDGLDSGGPTSTAKSIVDRYGRLWFTMIDGIAIYDPVKVFENPVTPLVKIESVTVDNKVVQQLGKTLVLKPGTRRIVIKYTGISFDAPERILFSHKLTNFEDEFSDLSDDRVLSYTNIKPGRHNFIVNAVNGDGLYSENPAVMTIFQKPYIYQVSAFWIFIVFIFLFVILIIFHLKQKAIRLENQRLEEMVTLRTKELAHEKDKSDKLLHAILPDKIADDLKDEVHAIGENFEDVTILFSDIVDFTKTSSGYSASKIVNALNDLFSLFDDRAKKLGVEKIKTIGDAYMAACGIPVANENHAIIMAQFAKGMLEDLCEYNKTAEIKFNIRIGMNCGPVTAGVIGKSKFIYDVWGDTVNVASRMESASEPGKIRVSEEFFKHLKACNFSFSEPRECNVKGKGVMTTFDLE